MSPEEKAKADEIYKAIIGKERNSLVDRYGKDAEKVAKGRAIKQAQKLAEKKMNSSKDKLREMVKSALMGTNEELKGGQKKLDVNKDGKISGEDFAMLRKGKMEEAIDQAIVLTDEDHENLMKNGSVAKTIDGQTVVVSLENFQVDMEDVEDYNLDEDLDLGHEDDEPHMIKAELYRIGKYAMELYQMVDQFEGKGEVDFPAWWQSKITTAKNMVSSAKHYLEFELKEPEIDAMVSVATGEEVIDDENSLMEDEQAILDQVRNKLLGLFQPYGDFKILDMTMKGQNTGENFRLYAKSKGADWKGLETFMRNNPNFTIKHISKQTFDNPKAIDFSYTTSIMEENLDAKYTPSEDYKYVVKSKSVIGLKGREDKMYFPTEEAAKAYVADKPEMREYIGIEKDDKIEKTLAQRIAKKLKEDVVKGSNIRKDSKGKWRVLSGKTGKMWPQTYDSKADAEDALQAYHATKG